MGQAKQAALVPVPKRDYEPGGQAKQADVTPVPEREYEPAGQARHWDESVAPVVSRYVPAVQGVQAAVIPPVVAA